MIPRSLSEKTAVEIVPSRRSGLLVSAALIAFNKDVAAAELITAELIAAELIAAELIAAELIAAELIAAELTEAELMAELKP